MHTPDCFNLNTCTVSGVARDVTVQGRTDVRLESDTLMTNILVFTVIRRLCTSPMNNRCAAIVLATLYSLFQQLNHGALHA